MIVAHLLDSGAAFDLLVALPLLVAAVVAVVVWAGRRSAVIGSCVAALIMATTAGADSPLPPTLVFLLAGQSNMQGRGQPLSAGEPSDPRLLAWRELANGGWRVAADPLASPNDPDNGVGPGMTFGLAVAAQNPLVAVGLIQCAKGGTSMAEWQPGGKLYQACMAKVAEAKASIAGVLFLQGETDALKKKTAQSWSAGFKTLAAAFRHDLHARVLLGQIGTINPAKYPYQQTVRDQQAAAAKKLGTPLVKTSALPVAADGVHFTVASYKVVGVRFAAAWAAS